MRDISGSFSEDLVSTTSDSDPHSRSFGDVLLLIARFILQLGPEMASLIRKTFHFVMYWYLTYIFAMAYFVYYFVGRLSGRIKELEEDKGKTVQPLCLSNPLYGTHKYFKNKGVKIHYVESGDTKNQVVILIHSTPGFWFCWRKQIPELAQFFRVIAVDLRGCGDSEGPTQREKYSRDLLIEDIICLMNIVGCRSSHVICCETSGQLGWELALRHPDLISKLVLINAPHPAVLHQLFHIKPYYNYLKYWYMLFIQIPHLAEAITSQDQTHSWLNSLLDPAIKAKVMTEEEVEGYHYTFSRKGDWRGSINHLRQIDLRPVIDKSQASAITPPTLMLVGSSHPYLTVEAAYRSAELAERIKIRVIQNASTSLQVTHSKRTNEEFIDFLVDQREMPLVPTEQKSLVGRVFGAVTFPYTTKNGDASFVPNGIKETARNTLSSGVFLAQTVWPNGYKSAYNKMAQIVY